MSSSSSSSSFGVEQKLCSNDSNLTTTCSDQRQTMFSPTNTQVTMTGCSSSARQDDKEDGNEHLRQLVNQFKTIVPENEFFQDRDIRALLVKNHMNLEQALDEFLSTTQHKDRKVTTTTTSCQTPHSSYTRTNLNNDDAVIDLTDLPPSPPREPKKPPARPKMKMVGAKPKVWSTYPKVEVEPLVEPEEEPLKHRNNHDPKRNYRLIGSTLVPAYR